MQIPMKVFSVDPVAVQVPATLADGSDVMATVKGKRVQLVSDVHGSWTVNLTGPDADAWTHAVGDTVNVTI